MRYSIDRRNKIYVKSYGFLSFTENIATHAAKVARDMSNKQSQKLLNSAKIYTADATKTASKRAIEKTAEVTGDLICNKFADNVTCISKSPRNASKKLHSKTDENEIEISKGRCIAPEKSEQRTVELRIV